MFTSQWQKDMLQRMTHLENVCGTNWPKIPTLENRVNAYERRVNDVEAKINRSIQRNRMHDDDIFVPSFNVGTPTSGLAEGAPLFTDGPAGPTLPEPQAPDEWAEPTGLPLQPAATSIALTFLEEAAGKQY